MRNIVLALFLFSGSTFGANVTKTWNIGSAFEDPKVWLQRRVPCERDRIVFQEKAMVYVNSKVAVKEIVLPMNGQIIFGEKGSIQIVEETGTRKSETECKGEDMIYSGDIDEKDWFDPINWNQTVYSDTFSGRIGSNPIPHSERVPCPLDAVQFPRGVVFKTRLSFESDAKVRALLINGKSYDTDTFRQLLETDTGKQLFFKKHNTERQLIIDGRATCSDATGCSCGNDSPNILPHICSYVASICPHIDCADPIKPAGFCCKVCGSVLTIDNYWDAVGYLSKTYSGSIQLVLVDKGQEKGIAHKLALALEEYLREDIQPEQPGLFSLKSVTVQSSHDWISDSGSGVGTVFLVLFLLILLGASVAGVIYVYKRRGELGLNFDLNITIPRPTASAFNFVRFRGFENEDGVELQLGTTPHEALDPGSDDTPSNPSSASTPQPSPGPSPIPSKPPRGQKPLGSLYTVQEEKINFDNPFFSEAAPAAAVEPPSGAPIDVVKPLVTVTDTEE